MYVKMKFTHGECFMEKIDARVLKTKKKLFIAFLELLNEKNYDDITINEICERAEIRRATFYKHFKDKIAFAEAMTAHLISRYDEHMKSKNLHLDYSVEYHVEYLRNLVEFLVARIDMIRLLGKSNMYPNLVQLVVRENYKALVERLTNSEKNGKELIASPDTIATVLAGGVGAGLTRWLMSDMTIDADILISEYTKVISAMFS